MVAQDIAADPDLGRAVRVTWIDSGMHYDAGWAKIGEYMDWPDMTAETVGLWMGENDDCIAVAQSRDRRGDNWMAAQLILKACILKKEWL